MLKIISKLAAGTDSAAIFLAFRPTWRRRAGPGGRFREFPAQATHPSNLTAEVWPLIAEVGAMSMKREMRDAFERRLAAGRADGKFISAKVRGAPEQNACWNTCTAT